MSPAVLPGACALRRFRIPDDHVISPEPMAWKTAALVVSSHRFQRTRFAFGSHIYSIISYLLYLQHYYGLFKIRVG